MNVFLDRRLLSEFAIVLALCIGGWMMFVQRKIVELQGLEAAVHEASAHVLQSDQGAVEHMAGQLQTVRSKMQAIEARNAFARDSSHLYGAVMSLAETHGVTVKRLDPDASKGTQADEDQPVHIARFSLLGEGDYESVASFLGAIDRIQGYVRPLSLTLGPREGTIGPEVQIRYEGEALSFRLPGALSALVESAHGDD